MILRDEVVNVGIIGCGRIVQTVHVAALSGLDRVRVVAVCDLDAAARDAVGGRLGVDTRLASWEELVALPELDAVFVATNDHVEPSLGALRAGKHLLVEKPLCFDRAAGAVLVEAARASSSVAMIAYMKRYDSCFEEACRLIEQLPEICFARVHDFACRFDKSDDLFRVVPPRTEPASAGAYSPIEVLLMFASHDFSIVRGAFGHPEEVLFVQAAGERTLAIGLTCARGVFCLLELSLDTRYEWFDETVTAFGAHTEVGVRFADPFVPYGRSTLWVRRAEGGSPRRDVAEGRFEDGFRREWIHFAECVTRRARPRTPLEDGLADIELAEEIAARWSGADPEDRAS